MLDVIDAAASLDSDIAALWDRIQRLYANQRLIVESLNEKGALKAGLDVDRATDILWTINHPNMASSSANVAGPRSNT